ncbi:defensin-like protein [Solanum dulcamara]|uniref:defensin-like protein n=1 Tax=Solanum dulcamara TaxID=45834 RepID=UPI002486A0F3|nr:defensin-like protein [Solanum dulcamara]
MARSVCFMAFLVLAMMLFVAYEVQAQQICKSVSQKFKGICITNYPCRKVCLTEGFTDGHCSKLQRRCLCTKLCSSSTKNICALKKVSNEVKTSLDEEAKTLSEDVLEEEIMME